MSVFTFKAIGTPEPEPRKRGRTVTPRDKSKKSYVQQYTPADHKVNTWKEKVRSSAWEQLPEVFFESAVRVDITFEMPRPKNHYRSGKFSDQLKDNQPYFHTKKPDRDNLEKAVLDALSPNEKADWKGIWTDDALVCCGEVKKIYANGKPGATVRITPLAEISVMQPELELANGF